MTTETDDRQNRTKAKPLPPIEYLRELFVVDPTSPSGLRWLVSRGKARKGSLAGYKCQDSKQKHRFDWTVGINGKMFKVARIIYFMEHGSIAPEMDIDHVNGNPLDNRVENMRLATRSQNNRNHRMKSANKSGVRGVCWHAERKKWRAQIRHGGKVIQLGVFLSIDDARRAREEAELRLHGEFSPLARKEGA
jgi:hypothetical protein